MDDFRKNSAERSRRYRARIKGKEFLIVIELDGPLIMRLKETGYLKDATRDGLRQAVIAAVNTATSQA
jgi:hypothetical protein